MSLPTSANLSLSQINSCLRFTNGNVGIGTTAPTSKLDINGIVNITGDFYQGGSIFSGGGGAPSYTSTVTYSTSANLSITQPTDIIVSGQAGNVNLSLTSLTNGNYITVHNAGNTNGNYNNSSVFVSLGVSSTSGSIVRLAKGERTRIVARSTNTTIPYGYRQITTRSPVSKQISAWTERAIPNGRDWRSVVWASELGLFCAVNNGTAFVMTSPDGITWTERSIPNARAWISVTWAPELRLFCAVNAGSAAFVMTSSDGITWTERAIPNTRSLGNIVWSPELGLFVANAGSTGHDITSSNGISWSESSGSGYNNLVWSPELGIFCSTPSGNTTSFRTSPNGVTWTERTVSATARQYNTICWSPELGLFCAISYTAAFVVTSPDGITWTERSIPNDRDWISVTWAPELRLFCATSNGVAAVIMTSSDGITWTERSIPNNRFWYNICWAPELMTFCAISQSISTAAVLTLKY